ncbi:MAG TPA: AraC family transcriptional regulator ligand-binding domain-containing protein [Geminicoccaceae bacterium]|nr:AraC family transcriptional regulator ligand-binding domain-containing protein [Geminicoccaceae bacterium]
MRQRRGSGAAPALLVDAVWARHVVAELDRARLPVAELLSAVGLRREQLSEPDAHIPFNAHVGLFENAATALREPCFGFRLGSAVELTEAGLLAYVTLNSPDLGTALRNLCRYLPLLTDGSVCELRRDGAEVRLLFSLVDPEVEMASRQLPEFAAALMVRICEAITGHRARPIRIELRHDPACPMLARHLGLPVMVYQPRFALVLDATALPIPVVNADARLLELLRRYADELLARRADKDDLVARAERWVLGNLHTGQVGATHLARGLGMSDRTLARHLAKRGLTPAGLVEELRQQLAGRYLAERAFPLGRITYLLGYSDLSAFTRAFRRWTGRTPSEWRSERVHTTPPPAPPALH